MEKINFNRGWNFTLQQSLDAFNTFGFVKYSDAAGAPARYYADNNWERVDLPHDWAPGLQKNPLASNFAGAYPNTPYHSGMEERHSEITDVSNIGWYRKEFIPDPAWSGKRVFIEFEGVFRDAIIWVNGVYLDRHTSGYTTFAMEITDHLIFGDTNSVAVRVDSEQPEGWWYEGSGIYRNVHLLIGEPVYFKYHQTVVRAETDGKVQASAVLVNDTPEAVQKNVSWQVTDGQGRETARAETAVSIAPFSEETVETVLKVASPALWSVDCPSLYTLKLQAGEEQATESFGFRSVMFDPDRGFLLNGVPLKIRGACVHQDFGGVGTALTDNLQYYKIRRLKEMGVNAYRCSHNAPAPALLRACDELGMLVMDETRLFGTSPEAIRQLTAIMERDRNHPCVFIWSLGNEEFSVQNLEWSFRLMEKMTRIARKLDPTRPITYAGNNGPDFTGANRAAEIRGVNYIRNGSDGYWLDRYHQDHPAQPIIGTEESSYVLSRGSAVNDLENGFLDSFGNVTMPWGSTPKGWVKFMEERDYFAGSFMWTGFDYRGEPNPFYLTNAVSSFGTIDLCGMEKPPFYYYKAWWTDEPVLKLFPHWNHRKGETVSVAVMTNCEEITLSLNGKVLETRKVERFDLPQFRIDFEPGTLSAEGRRKDVTVCDALITSGETAEVRCASVLEADDETETGVIELSAYDADGRFCPLASEEIELRIENGRIVGVGNGDSASRDYEQQPMETEIRLIAFSDEENNAYPIPDKKKNALPKRQQHLEMEPKQEGFEDDFRLVANGRYAFAKDLKKELTAVLRDVEDFEYIEFERLGGQATVWLNGEKLGDNIQWHGRQTRTSVRPYRFYTKFKPGDNELRVTFEYSENDLPLISGRAFVGKKQEKPWRVKLHYGKARVFIRSAAPARAKLQARVVR